MPLATSLPFGSRLRRWLRGRPIIVVSGLPRSGTSMAMRMLEAGGVPLVTDGIRSADASNPHGYFELERVKTLDAAAEASWLREARGRAVKVVSALLTHLPEQYDYQVVFMTRGLDEVLASQNAMLAARGEAVGPDDHRMRAAYETHLAQVDRFLARRPCFSVLRLEHRAAVSDPPAAARRIAAFLGRPLDEARMAAAVDRSLHRQRA